mmetsp:Transcript_13089/g.34632  ORF Transcript_13089/g.34632 Transcript_13089/m.34632 type:complete len:337 (+) Transcript_13089:990-2000(+)
MDLVLPLLLAAHDRALEAGVIGDHLLQILVLDDPSAVRDHVADVEVRNGGGPASADALRAVHEHHGHDGAVPLRLDLHALLVVVVEHEVVLLAEDQARHGRQARVDVPRGGGVLAALQASTELPLRNQQVHVVGAHKVLSHADNRLGQRSLAVVVRGMLGDVAHELRHLAIVLQLALEASEEHLTLARLEAIDHRGDRARHVCLGEKDKLLVDKVAVAHLRHRVVDEVAVLVAVDPGLPVVRALLVEGEVDGPVVLHAVVPVGDLVGFDGAEILLRLLCRASPQTLVVLDVEALAVVRGLLPHLILGHRVETHDVPASAGLHDGREELLEKARQLR